jgi:ParB-like nuclease domain
VPAKPALAPEPRSVIIVGPRKFMYSAEAQASPRITWWELTEERGEHEPAGLEAIFCRRGSARLKNLSKYCSAKAIKLIEFTEEAETFAELREITGLEPDPQKAVAIVTAPAPSIPVEAPAEDPKLGEDTIKDIEVARIRPFAGQPRTHFDQDKLRLLGRSILAAGQQVPIIVIPVAGKKDHDYQIYDGERRWRAAKLIGKLTLRAIVMNSLSEAKLYRGSAICRPGRSSTARNRPGAGQDQNSQKMQH